MKYICVECLTGEDQDRVEDLQECEFCGYLKKCDLVEDDKFDEVRGKLLKDIMGRC